MPPATDWEQRLAAIWASADSRSAIDLVAAIDDATVELSADDGVGPFERAAARDWTGRSDLAVPLHRQALSRGLSGERRRRAVIQLASSLRNLGRSEESVRLLEAELEQGPDQLDDAVRAFLALALVDVGRQREAVSQCSPPWHSDCPDTSVRRPTMRGCCRTMRPSRADVTAVSRDPRRRPHSGTAG